MAKFVIVKKQNNKYQFKLLADNGQVILFSDDYPSKSEVQHGINSIRENSQFDDYFERKTSSKGKHYFILKAINGQVIARSDLYASEAGLENGISSVKRNSKVSPVDIA